jgi:hypothetical protein
MTPTPCVTDAQITAFARRWSELEIEIVGMVQDPNDPDSLTAAEGVDLPPEHYDAILVGRGRGGRLDILTLAMDTTLPRARTAANAAARVLHLASYDITER